MNSGVGERNWANSHWGPQPIFDDDVVHRKPRDLFPLPVEPAFQRELKHGLSRACVRRLQRRDAIEKEVQSTVAALNSLYFGGAIQKDCPHRLVSVDGASLAQKRSLEFIRESLQDLGPVPSGFDGPGALMMLRASSDYGDDSQTPSSLGSYDPEKLSLPEKGNVPVPLDFLWGKNGRDFVGAFVNSVTLPENDARANIRASGVKSCYSDPLLKHPKTFSSLIKRLHECGLVSFSLQPPTAKLNCSS